MANKTIPEKIYFFYSGECKNYSTTYRSNPCPIYICPFVLFALLKETNYEIEKVWKMSMQHVAVAKFFTAELSAQIYSIALFNKIIKG